LRSDTRSTRHFTLSVAHHDGSALLDPDFFDSRMPRSPLPCLEEELRRLPPPKSAQPSHRSCPFAPDKKPSFFLRFPLPSCTSTPLPRIFLNLYFAPQLHSFTILHSIKDTIFRIFAKPLSSLSPPFLPLASSRQEVNFVISAKLLQASIHSSLAQKRTSYKI
jgi:hypothetical protein